MLGGGATGGGGGLGLDLTAVIQAAVVGLVLFSAAVVAVRRAASRYFVVDAAGFAASYDDHHHSQDAYTMPSKNGDAAGETGPCAECGGVTSKKCSGCKRVRYCSSECQSKHWRSDHKFKCKQMKLLDPADKLSCGGDKSSGFGRISLVPRRKKFGKVLFPYDEFLKLYNWKDFEYIPCGLMNCGNSCFANVVLQCLSCTRPLVAYLLGKDHSRECSTRHDDWCFLCELQSHIQKASESLHPFAPMNILSHLPNIGGNLGFGRQEDAHEFMRFAIDKMQSACLDEYGGEKAVDLSTQETTIIQHIFGGRLQSQVQCTACGMVSNRYDNMMDLTVEIQGDAESLEKCLDQFTAVEWLDGDNKYKCDGCNDYVKARKHLSVHQAPNILTITLKRFQSGRFGKLNKRVTFPMELDLTPYMSTTDGSDLYDLYAVVVHLDMLNASFFGHYICYIKGYRGTWYKIDDCKVMTVDEEEVHAQGAYMLLYSRRTARPRPLTAVEEPMKEQQQCKVLPSNGQNHLILADASLSCESPSKSSEDLLQQDSEPNDESLHKMDTINQEPDLGLHTSSEDNKFFVNENLHSTGSPASHVFEDSSAPGSLLESNMSMRTAQLDPPLEHPTTMNSVQFANSTNEAFSVHSFTEQSEEPASSIDSVDYMDIDTEAGAEVTRWNEGPPVLDNSVEKTDDETLIPSFANGMTRKPKPLFSRGFLDKGTTKRSSFVEEGHIGGNNSQKLNGHCNGHHSSVEQAVLVNSCGSDISTGSAKCNGDMFETPSNGNYYATNGETQFRNDSLHAQYQDVPSVARGFEPRPYRNPSGSNKNCRDTKPLLDGQNKSSLLLPSKEGISFLHRGFLERPCSETKSVKVDGTLAFNNGKLPFVNGNNRPINNSSSPRGLSRGYTRHHKETAVIGTSMTSMQGLETSSGTSIEQKPNGAAVVSERVEERLTSDCTANGSSFQLSANSDHNASTHLDENCHAILATKNTSCGLEIDNNGSPDLKGLGCQRNEPPAIENSMEYENNGLRRRTSKFFEQNGIDAK